jgi:predicted HicB family RNase H-like nuclease
MKYNGYTARIEFDDQDNILIGRLIGVADDVSFHADNVSDLRKELELAVDHYLDYCKKTGKSPTRSASGKMALRLPPEIHQDAAIAAQAAGISLNQWLVGVIGRATSKAI